MSCFDVKILDPDINTITIESCIGDQPASIEVITYDNTNILEINSCLTLGDISVKDILAGSGINIATSSGIYTISLSDPNLTSSDISDFLESVQDIIGQSGLYAGNYINLSYNDITGLTTISVTGLQPSGNYSVVGHNHLSSDITNFNSSVSGLLPTISNSGDNRILTSTGSSVGINAESNLTFDGSVLNIDGNLVFDSFTESVVSIGSSSSGVVLSISSGTVQTCTLTNNCTFTMPTATAGKSFTMFLNSGSGNFTASFSGVLWSDSSPPTITTASLWLIVMFSIKINFLKDSNRLFTKSQLQSLDYTYRGQPFCDVVSKNQDTKNLDITYKGQIFIGTK